MHRPGFEPGSKAWKASILAVGLPTHNCPVLRRYYLFINLLLVVFVLDTTCFEHELIKQKFGTDSAHISRTKKEKIDHNNCLKFLNISSKIYLDLKSK